VSIMAVIPSHERLRETLGFEVPAERHRLWRRSTSQCVGQCAGIDSSSLPQSQCRSAPKYSNAISDEDH